MSPLLFLLVIIAFDLVPVLVFVIGIAARARRAALSANWYMGVAFFGGLTSGMVANGITVQYILIRAQQMDPFPHRYQLAAVLGSGVLVAAAVTGAVYQVYRLRTARDPDYEELPDAPTNSQVTHIPQPRDGDDVLPE